MRTGRVSGATTSAPTPAAAAITLAPGRAWGASLQLAAFRLPGCAPPRPPLWDRTAVLPPVSSVVLWGVARYPAGRWGAVCSLFGRLPLLAGSVLAGPALPPLPACQWHWPVPSPPLLATAH